jgi:ABC-type Na+ efflux pump permease subunit
MKAKRGFVTGKLMNVLIVALVLTGTAAVAGIGEVPEGSSIMVTLFLGFVGAIIAIQIIPCLILFGAMAKGVFDLVRGKKETEAETGE